MDVHSDINLLSSCTLSAATWVYLSWIDILERKRYQACYLVQVAAIKEELYGSRVSVALDSVTHSSRTYLL